MARQIQITFDAAAPRALAAFWCEVLGYVEQPPPPGFDTWEEALTAFGIDQSDPERAFALVDPDGVGPRASGSEQNDLRHSATWDCCAITTTTTSNSKCGRT